MTRSKRFLFQTGQGLHRAAKAHHLVAGMAQHIGDRLARGRMIVNDQHSLCGEILRLVDCSHAAILIARRGISIVKAAPPSGQLFAVIRPPCDSAIRCTIASPNPVPVALVE